MNGLLIVNNFIDNKKFSELYQLFQQSSKRNDIILSIRKSGDIAHNIDYIKTITCDFVLFWDKDVLLATMFEMCGIRVFNRSSSIFFCDNKGYTSIKLSQANIRTPKTYIAPLTFEGIGYSNYNFIDYAIEQIGFPLIIKELYGSFGQQVYLIHNNTELLNTVNKIGCKGFLIQEFIESSFGKDVRINVVGNKAVSAMLRYSDTGDFKSNISNGGKFKNYNASPAQKELAINACKALGLDFAGVDILFGNDNEPIICEVNSNPHFKSSLICTGIDMSDEILKYIRNELSTSNK